MKTLGILDRYQSQSVGFILVPLEKSKGSLSILMNKPTELAPGVIFTRVGENGDALLEVDSSCKSHILVNKETVIDIVHVKPGQTIVLDENHWIYLKPYQVFVNARVDRTLTAAEKILLKKTELAVGREHPATPSIPTKARGKMVLICAAFVTLLLLAVVMLLGQEVWEPHPNLLPQKPVVKIPTAPAVPAPETPGGSDRLAGAAPVVGLSATPVKSIGPGAAKVGPVGDSAPKKSALTGEQEQKVRAEIARIILEFDFDPERTLIRLKELKAQLPANSNVALDLQRKIAGMTH